MIESIYSIVCLFGFNDTYYKLSICIIFMFSFSILMFALRKGKMTLTLVWRQLILFYLFSDVPQIVVEPHEVDINETESTVLTCTATGSPLPR